MTSGWIAAFWLRIKALLRRHQLDCDLQDELQFHLSMREQKLLDSGMPKEDANATARRRFGNITGFQEACRDMWTFAVLETLVQDARYGLRQLRRNPGFTAVAVITLALGIGANTAIFSVLENVLLRPLPFTDADQLVHVLSTKAGVPIGGPSPMDMRDFANGNRTFQDIIAYDTWRKNVSLSGKAEPEQMLVGLVPGTYFKILDIKPIIGRLFTDHQGEIRKNYVAVISAQLWRNRYASEKNVLGREIRINDEPYTIVAVIPDVIPPWMDGASNGDSVTQIWTPFAFADSLGDLWTEAGRAGRGYYTVGRLKRGVSIEQAQSDLTTIAARLAVEHPIDQGVGVKVERLSETRVRNLRPMLFLLIAAVSLMLLIACLNLANLLLARNSVREDELAMRAALGAGRIRLVRQLLAEALLLSLAGGGIGLCLAQIGVAIVARMHPEDLPQLSSMVVDSRVLVFAALTCVVTTLIFGLAPALIGTRLNLLESLKQGSRSGGAGSEVRRFRNSLVVMEIALSLILLVGAGLLVQSIVRLEGQELGVRADHLLIGHFYLPPARYTSPAAITRFTEAFVDKVRALPGVLDATVTSIYPPNNRWRQMLEIPGYAARRIQDIPVAQFGLVDAHFLKTLGIPLIRGRDFNESDTATSPPVALVSLGLVRRYFRERDPIGQHIHIGPPRFMQIAPGATTADSSDVTIAGVFGDFRNDGLGSPSQPLIVALYSQHPLVNYGFKDIVIRSTGNPRATIPEISRVLHDMDPELPFAQTRTLREIVERATGSERFTTALLGLFAIAGLALAAVGIFGVISYTVAKRTHEMGIRIALGAQKTEVLGMVVGEGLRLALIGVAVGIGGALGLTRFLSSLLYGVKPTDMLTFAAVSIVLISVALFASYIPARRAAKVDPIVALRYE